MVAKLSEIWSELFIPDPDTDFLPIPDPGSRGQKGTGSWIRIRNTGIFHPFPFSKRTLMVWILRFGCSLWRA